MIRTMTSILLLTLTLSISAQEKLDASKSIASLHQQSSYLQLVDRLIQIQAAQLQLSKDDKLKACAARLKEASQLVRSLSIHDQFRTLIKQLSEKKLNDDPGLLKKASTLCKALHEDLIHIVGALRGENGLKKMKTQISVMESNLSTIQFLIRRQTRARAGMENPESELAGISALQQQILTRISQLTSLKDNSQVITVQKQILAHLKKKDRDKAAELASVTIKRLMSTQKRLEAEVRKLRNQAIGQLALALVVRCKPLVQEQVQARKTVQDLYSTVNQRGSKVIRRAERATLTVLANKQLECAASVSGMKDLVNSFGNAKGITVILNQVQSDLKVLADRMKASKLDKITVLIQKQTTITLEELLAAFEGTLKKIPDLKNAKPLSLSKELQPTIRSFEKALESVRELSERLAKHVSRKKQ